MSGYLARLKEVEKRKNFHNSPESELTKPPKGASVSFVSSVPEENKKNSDVQSLQIEQVRQWLFKAGEPEEDHYLVIDKCKADHDAMNYFFKYASGEFDS
ncbi:hypothetical protein C8R26_103142 [Nitrosomonas oligotropha]|uniref:Uncharacterized protein n=1 Tax=Nitrosomonas oligotropha TaxID=42354 RepID=A0A2T5I3J1_9PROT|nr:hypothetical protein [Nitrosomonas oligotropha]PTQ78380.1 hypothetical protein C8R26_103142 [Nitrosomonas oligotropha]